MIRILYGGTFDPVHNGHLAVADAAAACFSSDVFMLPAADPPHRAPPGARAEQRATLLDLAIIGHPLLHVDRRELHRSGPSYTVDTLREVRAEIGDGAPLAWLLGADAFAGLPAWHRWRELFALAHLIVAVRPGYPLAAIEPLLQDAIAGRLSDDATELERVPAGRIHRLDLPPREEAASDVRRRAASDALWADDVPPAVAAFIRAHRLYGCEPTPPSRP